MLTVEKRGIALAKSPPFSYKALYTFARVTGHLCERSVGAAFCACPLGENV